MHQGAEWDPLRNERERERERERVWPRPADAGWGRTATCHSARAVGDAELQLLADEAESGE